MPERGSLVPDSQLPELDLSNLEEKMVAAIVKGYFVCREFFHRRNENSESNVKGKEEFLKEICKDFLSSFRVHPWVMSSDWSEALIEKYFFVPIRFRDGGFEFPRSFTTYMDYTVNRNLLPRYPPDLSEMDSFMSQVSGHLTFEMFLSSLFQRIRRIEIPLRPREVALLRLLADVKFLRGDMNEGPATIPASLPD